MTISERILLFCAIALSLISVTVPTIKNAEDKEKEFQDRLSKTKIEFTIHTGDIETANNITVVGCSVVDDKSYYPAKGCKVRYLY